MDGISGRRLRAVFRTAVTWGVAWGALGSAVAALIRLSDKIPFGLALLDGIGMGVRIGVVGAIAGAAFSTFIGVAYRGKRLAEISALRFGIGGAILAGLVVPAWMQTMNLLTGGGLVPLNLITDDIVLSAAFGGIVAAGTMILAQRDEAKNPAPVEDPSDSMEPQSLGPGEIAGYPTRERTRSAEQR